MEDDGVLGDRPDRHRAGRQFDRVAALTAVRGYRRRRLDGRLRNQPWPREAVPTEGRAVAILDLSNNNATGHNFKVAYIKGGQRRVYLKRCEGTGYTDRTFPSLRTAALGARFQVGAYDFLHPLQASPKEAARYFLRLLVLPLKPGRDLRPCLDCEQGTPSPQAGRWITEVAKIVTAEAGVKPLIYGGGWWLEGCQFPSIPGPLWLAAYGRNDGEEYPVGKLPKPWKTMAAHQYTSEAQVVGINGRCDLSHVFVPSSVDVPKRAV